MLINCPRCGFQQPKDRYCAQCGVDIENYRPPRKSAVSRLTRNPVLQVLLVIGIATVAGVSLYQQQSNEIEERVNYLKRVQVVNSLTKSDDAPTAPAVDDETTDSVAEIETDETKLPLTEEEVEGAASLVADSAAATRAVPTDSTREGQAATATPDVANVRIFVAEISRRALDELHEESRALGQFNKFADYYAGIIPHMDRKIAPSNKEIKVLFRDQKPIGPQRPVQFFQGINSGDLENEIGFRYYIEMQETDGVVFRGHIELIRSWRDQPQMPLQKEIYPAVFELTQGSGFFMSGLIPRRSLFPNEGELLNISPFEILNSRNFLLGASDSILFLEFARP